MNALYLSYYVYNVISHTYAETLSHAMLNRLTRIPHISVFKTLNTNCWYIDKFPNAVL